MAMPASAFFANFKKLNAYMRENQGVSSEFDHAFAELAAAFRTAYTPDAFREAVTNNKPVDSDLEERLTSVLVIFNRERATGH